MKMVTVKFLVIITLIACNENTKVVNGNINRNAIDCNDKECYGTYKGPEFIGTSDIAHQFSNEMSAMVGNKLKDLYVNGNYSKVDFNKIKMSTIGMGSGEVIYKLRIPFLRVQEKCRAFTSFDHVGGWNHRPALSERKMQLQNVLLKGDTLNISSLKTTSEGLQEYWIQWRNRDIQSACQ